MKSDTEYMAQVNEVANLIAAQAGRHVMADDGRAAHAILDAGFRKDEALLADWERQIEALVGSAGGREF